MAAVEFAVKDEAEAAAVVAGTQAALEKTMQVRLLPPLELLAPPLLELLLELLPLPLPLPACDLYGPACCRRVAGAGAPEWQLRLAASAPPAANSLAATPRPCATQELIAFAPVAVATKSIDEADAQALAAAAIAAVKGNGQSPLAPPPLPSPPPLLGRAQAAAARCQPTSQSPHCPPLPPPPPLPFPPSALPNLRPARSHQRRHPRRRQPGPPG
jgi:hypothetical protein